jgi:hypothetical protein
LDQQKEYLENLPQELMQMGNVTTSTNMMTDNPDIFQIGCLMMSLPSAESFLLDLGSIYVLRLVNAHRENHENEYKALLQSIAQLFLHLVHKIYVVLPERNDSNGPINRLDPATTPVTLVEGGAFRFMSALIKQMDCL